MRCHDIRPQIYELADRALTEAQADEVRRHLASCDGCAAWSRQWERLRAGFDYMPRPALPRSMAREALREAERPEPRSWWRPLLVPSVGAAMAAVGIIFVLTVVVPRPPSGSQVGEPALPRVVADAPTFSEVLPDTSVFGREHALFAKAGTPLDRDVWTAAANLEALSLFDR